MDGLIMLWRKVVCALFFGIWSDFSRYGIYGGRITMLGCGLFRLEDLGSVCAE